MVKARKKSTKKTFFKKFKLTESYTSLLFGAVAVLIIGILLFSFAKISKNSQTSSTQDNQTTELQKSQDTSSTYTIKSGDDLWSISEDIFKDGYKWVEIAKVNKLEDPGLIHVGNKLIIPTVTPTTTPMKTTISQTQETTIQNGSIIGNIYKIKEGDNLWDISVRAYGDGYRWVELARVNKLENPDLIFVDNVLKLPRS